MPRSTPSSSTSRRSAWKERLPTLLHETFGFEQLRNGQGTVIDSVMSGRPTLAVMPTGAGKSLCYQLPALLLPGATIVASPLIALMKDQCDKLRELGVAAVQLNSAIRADETAAAEAAIAAGEAKIVFTTPERLADRAFLELAAAHPVSLVVVDEAHCISQWGHDFRPAFLEIGGAVARLGKPAVLALTATATQAVIDDIGRQLDVGRFEVVDTGMYRPNLRYRVVQVTNEAEKLARAVERVTAADGSGIVYAATVKAAIAVHGALVEAGVSTALYHGKRSAAERREQQDAFMSGRARVMVATNAFGLGIDKADTRFVVHYQMPGGLDAYYQETGRAGRDSQAADCVLLFLHADKAVQQFFLAGKYPTREDLAALYGALHHGRPDAGAWTLEALQEALGRPKSKLQVGLRLLRHQGVAQQDRSGRLKLTREGLGEAALDQLLQAYRDKRESDRTMLERMVFYGQTGFCRWKVLLGNFDEAESFTACGSCDNCARIAARLAEKREAVDESDAPVDGTDRGEGDGDAQPLPSFANGDAVRVPRYGQGIVEGIDAQGVTVRFAEGSSRVFLADFVRPAASRARGRKTLPQAVPADR